MSNTIKHSMRNNRNPVASSAMGRRSAGPMKDRREPRGGATNSFLNYMDEAYEQAEVDDLVDCIVDCYD